MNTIFLDIDTKGRFSVHYSTKGDRRYVKVIQPNKIALAAILDRLFKRYGEKPVMCSSSIDFPKEHTKDKKVIAFCNWLRG